MPIGRPKEFHGGTHKVRLHIQQEAWLKEEAAALGVAVSDIVRALIDEKIGGSGEQNEKTAYQ